MTHEIYHLITDESDQFLSTIEEVRNVVSAHKQNGSSKIKIFKMTAEERDEDEILLSEIDIPQEELFVNN